MFIIFNVQNIISLKCFITLHFGKFEIKIIEKVILVYLFKKVSLKVGLKSILVYFILSCHITYEYHITVMVCDVLKKSFILFKIKYIDRAFNSQKEFID